MLMPEIQLITYKKVPNKNTTEIVYILHAMRIRMHIKIERFLKMHRLEQFPAQFE